MECFTSLHHGLDSRDTLFYLREANDNSKSDHSDSKYSGTVNINLMQIIPAGPFTDPVSFPSGTQTIELLPPPLPGSWSDTYQTEVWDEDHWTHRRSLYPISLARMNRSGTTKHTLPPDCLGHHGQEKEGMRIRRSDWSAFLKGGEMGLNDKGGRGATGDTGSQ